VRLDLFFYFYLSFYSFLTIFLYSFVASISFFFFCYLLVGGGWGENGGQLGFLFYFLFTYLYWKEWREDTIASGGDSKESWLGEGKGDVYLIFFLYISGRYHKQTLSCRHIFCLNFPHFFTCRFSLHSPVFPCMIFFPCFFFLLDWLALPYIFISYTHYHSVCPGPFIHPPIHLVIHSLNLLTCIQYFEISLMFTCYHNYFTLLYPTLTSFFLFLSLHLPFHLPTHRN